MIDKSKKDVLLEVNGVSKLFGKKPVLSNVSFTLHRSEALVIVGPSGCGKSTLLRCLNGLEPVNAGDILLNGGSIVHGPVEPRLVHQKIGMVFQSYDLFPHLNVLDNLLLGPLKVQRIKKEEATWRAQEMLERVGLGDRGKSYPRQLSGGQKQRIAIARALCMNPEIILFDEVTAALDPEMVAEVLGLVQELATGGTTMVVVTHEMNFARAIADRVLFLDNGEVLETTPASTFFKTPRTTRAQQFLDKLLTHHQEVQSSPVHAFNASYHVEPEMNITR